MKTFSDKLPALIQLEGVAGGGLDGIRMEQAEAVFADFVIVGVGDPAFKRIVVECHPSDKNLDFKVHSAGQVFDDGFDLPQLAILIALEDPEVPIDGVLNPEGGEFR